MAAAICCWQSKKWNRLYNEQRSHWFAASVNHWSRFVFLLHLSLSLSLPHLLSVLIWWINQSCSDLWTLSLLSWHRGIFLKSNYSKHSQYLWSPWWQKMWLHMLVDTVFSQPLATLWPHKACWCVRVCVCGPSGVQRGCISSIFGLWYNQSQGGTAESKPAGSVPLWVSYRADVSSSSVCIWHLTCGSFSMDLLQKCRVNICTFR